MCGCEPGFTCTTCKGTPFDLAYFDQPGQKELEQEQWDRLISGPDFRQPFEATL